MTGPHFPLHFDREPCSSPNFVQRQILAIVIAARLLRFGCLGTDINAFFNMSDEDDGFEVRALTVITVAVSSSCSLLLLQSPPLIVSFY